MEGFVVPHVVFGELVGPFGISIPRLDGIVAQMDGFVTASQGERS